MILKGNRLKLIILLICISLTISSNEKRKSFKELVDLYLGKLDINGAYLSYDQYISLLNSLEKDFPNHLIVSSIGKTYEGNDMPLVIMKSPLIQKNEEIKGIEEKRKNYSYINNNETIYNSLVNKSGILFNGMHHGREPVSMMMNIYLILHLLSLPKSYLHLFLSSTNIYFIPIINIDTYKYNSKKYLSGYRTKDIFARKNRKPHKSSICKADDIGVDLNRNYDYFFAKDNEGSSNKPCQEDYRGEYPFSEPETRNIKNFIDSHPNIKIALNYHSFGNLIITPFNYLKHKESVNKISKEFPVHFKMYEDFKNEGQFPQNFLFGNADNTIKYITNGDATDWFLGAKKILSFSPELGNGNKESDIFYPNKIITFDIIEKNLYGGLYAIQKSMYYLKGELISAEYSFCSSRNRFGYGDIYFNRGRFYQNNNLKDNDIKNCLIDEMVLNVKAKIINKGFGDYTPGLEFPDFKQTYIYNNGTEQMNSNKTFIYFLSLDLQINIEKIKSVCYWSTLKTLYTIETNNNNEINKKEPEETQYIGDIRCVNKLKDLNNIELFIDNEIKSMEFIILNIQIIVKKDKFNEKMNKIKNNKRFLNLNYNNKTNNDNMNDNFIKIYTKNERIIKSERINGEIIEWKFNTPEIGIKIGDFIEKKNSNILGNTKRMNPYKILTIIICVTFLMMFFIYRMIKTVNGRAFHELLMDSINGSRVLNENNNNEINIGMNNERIVNNLENAEQNDNRNNIQIPSVQIPREDSEASNHNSNSDSPNELNA